MSRGACEALRAGACEVLRGVERCVQCACEVLRGVCEVLRDACKVFVRMLMLRAVGCVGRCVRGAWGGCVERCVGKCV